jgi:hypothetical protein
MMTSTPYLLLICLFLMNVEKNAFGQHGKGHRKIMLLESTFEHGKKFTDWSMEVCRPDAITVSKKVFRKGRYSARIEFAQTDPLLYNGFMRAELKQKFPSDTTGELWYGFSHYLEDWVCDSYPEVVAQWHEIPDFDLGETWRSPPISLEIKDNRYTVKVLWASNAVNTNQTKDGEQFYDVGPVKSNVWVDWVFHIKFRYDSTGVLEVWRNKKKVLTRNGPNSYNDKHWPYFKLGIYKWPWAGGGSNSPESQRVLFLDEVRVGNRYSGLKEVSPK